MLCLICVMVGRSKKRKRGMEKDKTDDYMLTLTREILLNHGFKFFLETNEKDETEFVVEF